MEYLLLIAGFIILISSGKFLIKGSISLAYSLQLSKLVVGITVVSFGTSAPELFVSVMAAVKGHPEISIGNVVGSNIANIGLILGLTAVILPVPVHRSTVITDWPVMMLATLLFYVLSLNTRLSSAEAYLFLFLLVVYLSASVYYSRKNNANTHSGSPEMKISKAVLFIAGSSIGLALGSYLLVENASVIAKNFGVGERVISITLIAVGTSIPELTTSISAALKKEMDISVGNIIGSNIFNILGILGVSGAIKSIDVPRMTLVFDIYWVIGTALLLLFFILPARNSKITRIEGISLMLVYSLYIFLLLK